MKYHEAVMAGHPTPANIPPLRKKGFNKALLRKTHGLYGLDKALFLGEGTLGGRLTSHEVNVNKVTNNLLDIANYMEFIQSTIKQIFMF